MKLTTNIAFLGQMLAARIGVGVGEAGCSPPAHSLIADYYPPEQRASALSVYALGIPIGSILGLLAGGWIAEFYGWRTAFLMASAYCLVAAIALHLFSRAPRTNHVHAPQSAPRMTSGEWRSIALIGVVWGLFNAGYILFLSFGPALLEH